MVLYELAQGLPIQWPVVRQHRTEEPLGSGEAPRRRGVHDKVEVSVPIVIGRDLHM